MEGTDPLAQLGIPPAPAAMPAGRPRRRSRWGRRLAAGTSCVTGMSMSSTAQSARAAHRALLRVNLSGRLVFKGAPVAGLFAEIAEGGDGSTDESRDYRYTS